MECSKLSSDSQYQKHRDKRLARQADYYRENRETKLAYSAEFYQQNKDRYREKSRLYTEAYRAEHPEQCKATARRHFLENREQYRLNSAAYRARNTERCRELNREWSKANPDARKAIAHTRRTRLAGADGKFTADDIAQIRAAQRDRCAYCRKDLKGRGTVDHITAVAKGGGNDRTNLQLTCRTCNSAKKDRDPIEFARQRMGLLL